MLDDARLFECLSDVWPDVCEVNLDGTFLYGSAFRQLVIRRGNWWGSTDIVRLDYLNDDSRGAGQHELDCASLGTAQLAKWDSRCVDLFDVSHVEYDHACLLSARRLGWMCFI
jgi:hypothetical protein